VGSGPARLCGGNQGRERVTCRFLGMAATPVYVQYSTNVLACQIKAESCPGEDRGVWSVRAAYVWGEET
jgi:hypothetical protein